ncbi:hypothetical protein AAF712_004394 [Marasmius tenuissimus]|uniref:Uncharacterized protein n=1 Tax=Marasmius tenuissimus TaxID=585030 RepID=A0ABR3A513_9AGAR
MQGVFVDVVEFAELQATQLTAAQDNYRPPVTWGNNISALSLVNEISYRFLVAHLPVLDFPGVLGDFGPRKATLSQFG